MSERGRWWEFDRRDEALRLEGAWQLAKLRPIEASLPVEAGSTARASVLPAPKLLDGAGLESLDSAAALILCTLLRERGVDPAAVPLRGFDPRHERTLRQVASMAAEPQAEGEREPDESTVAALGRRMLAASDELLANLGFLGVAIAEIGRALVDPRKLRAGELLTQLSRVCVTAVPVVALVAALIGLVFAYLLGLQAEQYGANIFVVDGVALGMTREFSPLIVAVIVAGRSGASFAAQLGTMRLNEETDAIRVLGMSVPQVLVVPRVLALVLALPLLIFVGDVAGLAGAALIADAMLGVGPLAFIDRLQYALLPRHAIIGLVKGPFFALLIAVIGCRLGMTGPRDTRTIGNNTTATVVQSIVGVIVIDAVFAVVLQEIGW